MSSRQSPVARKPVAIKHVDGQPLSRRDLQYDVLHHIFTDTHQVFTDPTYGGTPARKVCFRDLYVNAIMHSPKSSKMSRDKMTDVPNFATDFAMLSMLANVGRVNTTMSFFPEMKTAIRTYHPVPALQRTGGSLQDAPRLKSILKAALLEGEVKTAPTTPAEILSRANAGQIPPTSVTNLLFVLANHSSSVGQAHFSDALEFVDLFLPSEVSSLSRGNAFLWLCYHYLESSASDNDDYDDDMSTGNPFCDSHRPGKAPAFVFLTAAEAALENADTEDEKALGERLVAQRTIILSAQGTKGKGGAGSVIGDDDESVASGAEVKATTKRGANSGNPRPKEKKGPAHRSRKDVLKGQGKDASRASPLNSSVDDGFYNSRSEASIIPPIPPPAQKSYRRISLSPEPPIEHPYRFSPYKVDLASSQPAKHAHRLARPRSIRPPPMPPRSILQHTWHVITTTDALQDSDEDMGDEHDRHDYSQRLHIITRLRGKEPTPEPQRLAIPRRAHLRRPF